MSDNTPSSTVSCFTINHSAYYFLMQNFRLIIPHDCQYNFECILTTSRTTFSTQIEVYPQNGFERFNHFFWCWPRNLCLMWGKTKSHWVPLDKNFVIWAEVCELALSWRIMLILFFPFFDFHCKQLTGKQLVVYHSVLTILRSGKATASNGHL